MRKQFLCIILVIIMIMGNFVTAFKAQAAEGTFNGTYKQVLGFFFNADENAITFNPSEGTFTIKVNMYEGYYNLNGKFVVNLNQAICTVTDNNEFKGTTFTMTDINGNLVFEAEKRLISIETGALFKNVNAQEIQKSQWEDAYMSQIKAAKNENKSFNFALYDVDEDGTPELFIASYGFYNVFTYKNSECINLGTVNDHLYMWGENNSFITVGGLGAGIGGAMLYKIENGQLSEGEIEFYYEWPYGEPNGTFFINDRTVTEEQYDIESKEYINSAKCIYPFYCDSNVYIPNETRLSDYVTVRKVENPIKVLLDGKEIKFDQNPISDNDRTLVPLRAIFESLGATVSWDENTQTVTATKGSKIIKMQIGNQNISINGKNVTLDVAPKVVNNRTLVPVRAVAESFSAGVDWEDSTKTVYITSDFYNFNVNNLVKNKAFSIFSNPTSDNGYKTWEFNHTDDLNMTESEYKDYVNLTTVGAALVETGSDLANYDFINMFGNNNQKEYLSDAITRLIAPTEDELKTMLQKNLEGIASAQENLNDVISIGDDVIELYKEYKGNKFNLNQLLKDVGGEATDFGISVSLSTVNDTVTELILLKTIANTYNIVGENYEQFINQLSSSNTASKDKDLIVSLSKEIIAKYKQNSKDQILSALAGAAADNTIKEGIKWVIENGFSADKITSLTASIYLTVFKFFARDFIEASNSWLAFAGMNSIQKIAAAEYQMLLNQAKVDKMPLAPELQVKLKNAALVYIMSSIKCRNLLFNTVEKSHPNEKNNIEPLKNKLETRNDLAYKAFEVWKNSKIIAY